MLAIEHTLDCRLVNCVLLEVVYHRHIVFGLIDSQNLIDIINRAEWESSDLSLCTVHVVI